MLKDRALHLVDKLRAQNQENKTQARRTLSSRGLQVPSPDNNPRKNPVNLVNPVKKNLLKSVVLIRHATKEGRNFVLPHLRTI